MLPFSTSRGFVKFFLMTIFFSCMMATSEGFGASADYKLSVENYHQKYEYSCEAAALKVLLDFEKIPVEEDQIIKFMPMDKTARTDSIWGDPDQGFVGDIYGKTAQVSYGIHWPGLKKTAQHWKSVDAGQAKSLKTLILHLLNGQPLIVWVVSENASGRDLVWKTPTGKVIKAIEGEHTVVVYGFKGPQKKPAGVYILDPIAGFVYKPIAEFKSNWERLGNAYLAFASKD